MPGEVVLECCLEGVESAIQASLGGAHRVELCANLAQGGVTPSIGDIEATVSSLLKAESATRVHVLIRPRPGDFVYSTLEKQVMMKDVEAAVRAGAHGVVIGALLSNGGIDEGTTAKLIAASRPPCSVTFHRAFDCCTAEPLAALETLVRLGVNRVLTSGRHASAWDGRKLIAKLVEAGDGRIIVMPGAGVTQENVRQLIVDTGAHDVHVGSGCHETILQEKPQLSSIPLGFSSEGANDSIRRVSAQRVANMLSRMHSPSPTDS